MLCYLLMAAQSGYNQYCAQYVGAGKDTDMSAVLSPSKKAWQRKVKTPAEINAAQEKGRIRD